MDRLYGTPRLMIVSDLDSTMVDHDDPENLALLRFNALWEAYYRHDSLLVFSTGRSPNSYKQLRKDKPLLTPDIIVTSVGTEIAYGESMVSDGEWKGLLNKKWNKNIVIEETAKFPELIPQTETEQCPHKVSFFVEKCMALKAMQDLPGRLERRGLDVKIVYSSGIALDVLPKGAGKGQALAYLLEKFKVDSRKPTKILVCGDSGNDAELFSIPEVYGVMVSNAQEELLEWMQENAKDSLNIVHATERCAAGIMQAIGSFGLGSNISPRDTVEFSDCKVETLGPGYEVVMFYLHYERWRLAEIEKSHILVQKLRTMFHQSGILVDPSGVQRLLHHCIDVMESQYGDRQGEHFRLWVDQVSSTQIGSKTWQVKFYKWESSGEAKACCATKVLVSSKEEEPDEFTWLHVHQTWLVGDQEYQITSVL